MAKRVTRSLGVMHVRLFGLTVNGTKVTDVDYEHIDYDDGTYTERGLPPNCPPRPSLEQLFSSAMQQRRKKR